MLLSIRRSLTGTLLLLGCLGAWPTRAVDNATPPASDASKLEFFEKKIRPLLAERCYECHSTEAKKVKGGLRLDTREDLLKGGDTGPALVPGDPDKSRLIEAVRYLNQDLQMPPKSPLKPEQVRDLEKWVQMGAPDPREKTAGKVAGKRIINLEEGRNFWAFRPIANPPVPGVQNSKFKIQSPVDNFIFAKLEEKKLKPAPAADKRTLLRRATFDLTGPQWPRTASPKRGPLR